MQSSKWSFICFGFALFGFINWKHFCDLLRWSNDISLNYFGKPKVRVREVIQVSEFEANCGIPYTCPEDSFPVFLFTGAFVNNQPRLCIGGNHLIKPNSGKENRGLNGVVVEPKNFEVMSMKNFDTYINSNSDEILDWIKQMLDNDILIIFTSDEASSKLSAETKTLLTQLGSGKVQNLHYRSQWFMITQKGTQGFTTYEKITYSKKNNWGEAIEFRGCIPRKIPKKTTTADEPLKENKKRVEFCQGKKADEYKGFCNEPRFEIIMPALLTNRTLVGNPVYSLPIFLFASRNLEILISALDNLIHQPGVVVSLITILFESDISDAPNLAKLYGVQSKQLTFGKTFEEKLQQAKELTEKMNLEKYYFIVLDSDVIPSPDFLFFFAQILSALEKDDAAFAISAWSFNCYSYNGNVHLAYRILGVPKYGALLSSKFNGTNFYGETFAPDVSRVQGLEACHTPSLDPDNWIERPQDLFKDRYFHKMIMLQQISQTIKVDDFLQTCSESALKNETNVIYTKVEDDSLSKILLCLGILKNQYGKLELTKNDVKTSTQIGLPYSPARTVMYEKHPLPRVPEVRLDKSFKVNGVYIPVDGLKSTYGDTFKPPLQEEPREFISSKILHPNRDYSKLGRQSIPLVFGMTEYKTEFQSKKLPPTAQGISVEKATTCPMVMTGRDEREPLPLTQNYNKYLDIYLSTTRLDHRAFTLQEQKTIAMKDIVTYHETMNTPKGRGFGCKFPAFAGQDLDSRDKNMIDKALFKTEAKLKFIPKGMPKVPNFGSESETQAAYKKPEGCALNHLFDKFIEFPQTIATPTAKQTLCPPGMYSTETHAINNHTSPQTVV